MRSAVQVAVANNDSHRRKIKKNALEMFERQKQKRRRNISFNDNVSCVSLLVSIITWMTALSLSSFMFPTEHITMVLATPTGISTSNNAGYKKGCHFNGSGYYYDRRRRAPPPSCVSFITNHFNGSMTQTRSSFIKSSLLAPNVIVATLNGRKCTTTRSIKLSKSSTSTTCKRRVLHGGRVVSPFNTHYLFMTQGNNNANDDFTNNDDDFVGEDNREDEHNENTESNNDNNISEEEKERSMMIEEEDGSLTPANFVMVPPDLAWRVEKVRLETQNTKRFLKSGPRFLPYDECRKWVIAMGRWSTKEEWIEWLAMGEKRNSYIPNDPEDYYTKQNKWISWEHFLGTISDEEEDGTIEDESLFDGADPSQSQYKRKGPGIEDGPTAWL